MGALGESLKRGKDRRKNKTTVIHNVDFSELLSLVKNKKRRVRIEKNLCEINSRDYTIDIYEVQIETGRDHRTDQRYLNTICSNYIIPRSTTIWEAPGIYCGQTPYAFIKNREMWITDKDKKILNKDLNNTVEYTDALSNTPSDEIPDFWAPENKSNEIRTSVIIPLRLPKQTIACFGFIDFESQAHVELRPDLYILFKEIATDFALDYLENILKQAQR